MMRLYHFSVRLLSSLLLQLSVPILPPVSLLMLLLLQEPLLLERGERGASEAVKLKRERSERFSGIPHAFCVGTRLTLCFCRRTHLTSGWGQKRESKRLSDTTFRFLFSLLPPLPATIRPWHSIEYIQQLYPAANSDEFTWRSGTFILGSCKFGLPFNNFPLGRAPGN